MADDLDRLLRQVDSGVADQLKALQETLDADPKAAPPSAEGVRMWLNPDSIQERAEDVFGRGARKWEQFRNILTILPLVLTWAFLSMATYNYGYVSSRGLVDRSKPFLELWQAGFENQGPFPAGSFAEVAFYDVLILIALVGVTVVAHAKSQHANGDARKLRSLLEGRLRVLFDDIDRRREERELEALRTLMLGEAAGLREAAADVVKTVKSVLGDMGEERERLKALAAEREREYKDIVTITDNLKTSSGVLVAHAAGVKELNEGLVTTVSTLSTAVGSLDKATGGLGSLRDNFDKTLKEMLAHSGGLVDLLRDVLDSHTAFRTTLSTLDTNLSAYATTFTSRFDEVDRRTDEREARAEERAATAAAEIKRIADSLGTQAEALERDLGRLIARVPAADGIAREIVTVWETVQARHNTELQKAVRGISDEFALRLRDEVARPLHDSPLLSRGAERLEQLGFFVRNLDGVMSSLEETMQQVHGDAAALSRAISGLTGAMTETDGMVDIGETIGRGFGVDGDDGRRR